MSLLNGGTQNRIHPGASITLKYMKQPELLKKLGSKASDTTDNAPEILSFLVSCILATLSTIQELVRNADYQALPQTTELESASSKMSKKSICILKSQKGCTMYMVGGTGQDMLLEEIVQVCLPPAGAISICYPFAATFHHLLPMLNSLTLLRMLLSPISPPKSVQSGKQMMSF